MNTRIGEKPIKVLVAGDVNQPWSSYPDGVEVHFCDGSVSAVNRAIDPSFEVLLTDELPTEVDRCVGLRWIQLLSAGTGQCVGHPLMHLNVLLSTAAGMCAVEAAEFILARILYHAKRFKTLNELQAEHRWGDRPLLAGPNLREMTALLVGYGAIGRETARLLRSLGMQLIAVTSTGTVRPYKGYQPYDAMGDPEAILPDLIIKPSDMSQVAPSIDVIVIAVPYGPSTLQLIGDEVLSATKSSAILINVARGAVVDTKAVLRALDQGRLTHAFLDVFEHEPLPPSSPLWEHPRVTISPHMAGVIHDPNPAILQLFRTNLDRYRRGKRLFNQVDVTAFCEASVSALGCEA